MGFKTGAMLLVSLMLCEAITVPPDWGIKVTTDGHAHKLVPTQSAPVYSTPTPWPVEGRAAPVREKVDVEDRWGYEGGEDEEYYPQNHHGGGYYPQNHHRGGYYSQEQQEGGYYPQEYDEGYQHRPQHKRGHRRHHERW